MMHSTIQLEFDFRVPVSDPLCVADAAKCLGVSSGAVRDLILSGKIQAVNIGGDFSLRAEWRIPLKNFVAFLNREFAEELYFRFPADDPLDVPRIARCLKCSDQHIYNQIHEGEFPNAMNLASRDSASAMWRIPLRDFVGYINRRKEV